MNEIAKKAAKEHAKSTGKPGYVTEDGQIFDLTKDGKGYCLSYCSNKLDAWQFNEKGEAVEPEDEQAVRDKALEVLSAKYSLAELTRHNTETLVKMAATLSTDGGGADGGADGEINLDKMNKAQLIELLAKLDPTENAETLTKAKPTNDALKDKIEAANALVGDSFDVAKMKELAIYFGANTESLDNLELDELRAVVLYHRDNIELPESVTLKMTSQE